MESKILKVSSQAIAQVIRTRWCKCARHIQGAKLRATVPQILPLPDAPLGHHHSRLLVHEVQVDHVTTLEVRQRVVALDRVAHDLGLVSVELTGANVLVRVQGRPRCTLAWGQRAQIEYTHREEEVRDGWRHDYYHRAVLRISYGLPWDAHVFYCAPDYSVRELEARY
jgi:hypothetical protein